MKMITIKIEIKSLQKHIKYKIFFYIIKILSMSKEVNILVQEYLEDRLFKRQMLNKFKEWIELLKKQYNIKEELEKCCNQVSENLQALTSLKDLSIYVEYIKLNILSGCQSYEPQDFKHIYGVGGQKLTDFTVNTGLSNNFNDEAAKFLAEAIRNQPQLKSLTLKVDAYNEVTGTGMLEVVKALDALKHLESFEFSFNEDNQINAECLSVLGQYISQAPLKKLHLTFGNDTVTEAKGWIDLGASISKAKGLNHLVLSVGQNNKLGKQGIEAILVGFRELKELSGLKLFVGSRNNTEESSISCLGAGLEGLENLTHLRLRLSDWNSPGDESLTQFSNGLSKLGKLKHLHIQLGHLSSFTDKGTAAFTKTIENLKHLNKLDLQFGTQNNVNGESLTALSQSLGQLKSLERVRLSFESGNETTSEAMTNLGKALFESNAREISIHYADPQNCDGNKVLDFLATFKNQGQLQDLLFSAGESERIHFSKRKQSLTLQFKQNLTRQSTLNFITIIHNLSENIKKIKFDAREAQFEVQDVEALKQESAKLTTVELINFKIKNSQTTTVVPFLELFAEYLRSPALQSLSLDLGSNLKVQYAKPQLPKPNQKKQKQRGSQLLVQVDAGQKIGVVGMQIIKDVIKAEKALIKDISVKVGNENEITKTCLQQLSNAILDCAFLGKLSFEVSDSDDTEEVKPLITKVKQALDQYVKDKKSIISTYYAVSLKQYELVSSQLSPLMLDDVSTYLMKNQESTAKPATNPPNINNQFGGMFSANANKAGLSNSSFEDNYEDDEYIDQLQANYIQEE